MNRHLFPVLAAIVLAALPPAVRSQDPVSIQFQTAPVLVASGTEAVMTVVTVPQVLSMTWDSPARETLGLWTSSGPTINQVAQYQGRLTIGATQLRIAATQLRDSGNYSVSVTPLATTGQGPNSRSIELRVFDAVDGVRLFLPSVAIERGNVSLRCTWTRGTEIRVLWGKGGVALTADSRITISGGSLVINPARRGDAGEYSCTVSNLVSAQTATASLTVFYGPDTPTLSRGPQADCVGGGEALVGQTVRLTCASDSLPPALFSWQHNGVPVASGQPDSGVLSIQSFSTNQSGRYVCTARNAVTARTSEQGTDVAIVSTCLSGGAVAGIVIGCILALILIIIAIFLLLRWRKVDLRLRQATGNNKPDEDPRRNGPPLQPGLPHPRNHAHPSGNGRPGDHQLHNLNTLPHNGYALPHEGYHDVDIRQPHRLSNGDALRHNGQPNGRLNGQPNAHGYPPNAVANAETLGQSGWQNSSAFPQNGRQNPNILIQTGQTHPNALPPTVHVNLNTLPQHTNQQPGNTQPQTVHVNLNTFPNGGQQDPHALQHADQHNNHAPQNTHQHTHHTLLHTDQHTNHPLQQSNQLSNHTAQDTNQHNNRTLQHSGQPHLDGAAHFGHSDRTPLIETGASYPTERAPRGTRNHRSSGELVQTGYTHPVNPAPTGRRNANTQTYQPDSDLRPGRDPTGARRASRDRRDPAHSQMPWDRLRGTPAYPNYGFQGDSDTSTDRVEPRPRGRDETGRSDPRRPPLDSSPHDRRRKSPTEPRTPGRSARTTPPNPDPATPPPPYNQPASPQNQTLRFAPQGQDVQRPAASRGADRQPNGRPLPSGHAQAATHDARQQQRPQTSQAAGGAVQAGAGNLEPQTRPQHRGYQQQGAPLGPSAQAPFAPAPGQTGPNRQAPPVAAGPDPSPLTQSALQAHTVRVQNAFPSRNHQTAAALQHPGGAQAPPQPRPPGAGPAPPTAPQAAAPARRAPTPPPVLPLSQFQTLPRQHLPQPPAHPQRLPTAQHKHAAAPPHQNRQRHPQHAPGHPGHGHPNAHRHHGNAHPHPAAGHRQPTNQRQAQQAAWARARR